MKHENKSETSCTYSSHCFLWDRIRRLARKLEKLLLTSGVYLSHGHRSLVHRIYVIHKHSLKKNGLSFRNIRLVKYFLTSICCVVILIFSLLNFQSCLVSLIVTPFDLTEWTQSLVDCNRFDKGKINKVRTE